MVDGLYFLLCYLMLCSFYWCFEGGSFISMFSLFFASSTRVSCFLPGSKCCACVRDVAIYSGRHAVLSGSNTRNRGRRLAAQGLSKPVRTMYKESLSRPKDPRRVSSLIVIYTCLILVSFRDLVSAERSAVDVRHRCEQYAPSEPMCVQGRLACRA